MIEIPSIEKQNKTLYVIKHFREKDFLEIMRN